MSGHTPGPWEASDGGKSNYVASVTAQSKRGVTYNIALLAKPKQGDSISNARLIAAAPTMYELLVKLEEEAQDGDVVSWHHLWDEARKIFASVRGES